MTDITTPTEDAFAQEALSHMGDLLRFAMSLARDRDEAQDLVQETYLRALRSRHTYQPDRGMRQWLFTICRNVFLRARDRSKWVVEVEDDAELESLASIGLHQVAMRGGYEDVFDQMDIGPALERAMQALPDAYRVVFALVDLGDQSYAEVAEQLDIPIGTVRSRLFRARRELQTALIDHARDAGIISASRTTGGAT